MRKTRNANYRPKVVIFCWDKEKNKPFVFEAQNFRAQWILDVKGYYVFIDMSGTSGEYIDKEEFYEKAKDADICILLDYKGEVKTRDDLLKLNPEFRYFKAYKNGRFYVSDSDILLANMYDAGGVMEDYAKMVHPELFSGGDNELKHFVNIIKHDKTNDNLNSNSNSDSSTFDLVVGFIIGEDLYNCICGKEYSKVGLAIDIITLPIFEGKAIIIGAKFGAKKLIPIVVKSFVKKESKDVIEKEVVEKLMEKGLSREVIENYEKIGVNLNKLNYALDKLKGIKGYEKLLNDIKKGKSGAPYEAIVAAEKCNVNKIVELSKSVKTSKGVTEVDILTIDKVIECKGGDVTTDWNRFTQQL
ncbi:ABC transporter substrate-binding protein [Methanocaldococcus sp. 10A]